MLPKMLVHHDPRPATRDPRRVAGILCGGIILFSGAMRTVSPGTSIWDGQGSGLLGILIGLTCVIAFLKALNVRVLCGAFAITFAVLAIRSLSQVLAGNDSCGCLGALTLDPRLPATLAAAISALLPFLSSRDQSSRSSDTENAWKMIRFSWGASIILLLTVGLAANGMRTQPRTDYSDGEAAKEILKGVQNELDLAEGDV